MVGYIHPYEVLKNRQEKQGSKRAIGVLRLGEKTQDDFIFLNWREVFDRLQKCGVFLQSLGLKKGDRIAILGRNSFEWLLIDWAAMATGLVTVPLYPQSPLEEIRYILNESEVKILFTEQIIPELSILQISFLEIEKTHLNSIEQFNPDLLESDEIASIIYTSGTSGKPKGVMHTTRNFFEAVRTAAPCIRLSEKDRLLSYLPLSHVAERILIEFGCLYTGAEVYIIDRVERLMNFLPKARPTIFFAVPRVWDTIRFRIEKELRSQ
ncbi:MAG: Long-chain-fatty-acid--CoA ligase FadD15, partial [Bacteriovoracaceae bacterium]|nr:Long-chain-fatty-acid--CoA ligase FadD15 [Bacteriovoracaceae bacterium]